jgi:hypothetical protein
LAAELDAFKNNANQFLGAFCIVESNGAFNTIKAAAAAKLTLID